MVNEEQRQMVVVVCVCVCVGGGGVVFVYFMQAKSEGFPVIFPLCLLTRSRGREGGGG